MPLAVAVVTVVMAILRFAEGRARLVEPPMRSSYWREGIQAAPVNFEDELLNCGGYDFQWQQSNGKCGPCGDPHGSFPENQYPGKYSQFPPQRTYTAGSRINATVYARANTLGWFEFRLCPRRDGPGVPDLQACLDQNVLVIEETGMTRFYPGSAGVYSDMHVQLPADVSCDHCVLQWKYNTGYRVERNKSTCQECLGCGPQEQFYNCADIRITSLYTATTTPPTTTSTTPSPPTTTTTPTPTTTTPVPTTPEVTTSDPLPTTTDSGSLEACTPTAGMVACEAKGIHRLVPGMEQWCLKNCLSGKCRDQFCSCFCNYTAFKIKIDAAVFNRVSASPSSSMGGQPTSTEKKLCYLPQPEWLRTPGLAGWCNMFCPGKWCADMCQLSLC